ncbi:MAG: hypothetical protein KAF91_32605 [Nostoc sp. TH1S01]|nr:hypothetical protein [Nostoc sp. TH1S01]
MPLFLVTSLIDEGMYDNDFQLVEAESNLAIAQHMLAHPHQWENHKQLTIRNSQFAVKRNLFIV